MAESRVYFASVNKSVGKKIAQGIFLLKNMYRCTCITYLTLIQLPGGTKEHAYFVVQFSISMNAQYLFGYAICNVSLFQFVCFFYRAKAKYKHTMYLLHIMRVI